jgi:hypothetical protein
MKRIVVLLLCIMNIELLGAMVGMDLYYTKNSKIYLYCAQQKQKDSDCSMINDYLLFIGAQKKYHETELSGITSEIQDVEKTIDKKELGTFYNKQSLELKLKELTDKKISAEENIRKYTPSNSFTKTSFFRRNKSKQEKLDASFNTLVKKIDANREHELDALSKAIGNTKNIYVETLEDLFANTVDSYDFIGGGDCGEVM